MIVSARFASYPRLRGEVEWVIGKEPLDTRRTVTPNEFIAKWHASELKERSAAQEHFIDLCRLLGEPTPAEADPKGDHYCFERGALKDSGGGGWADVWKRHCFAWGRSRRRRGSGQAQVGDVRPGAAAAGRDPADADGTRREALRTARAVAPRPGPPAAGGGSLCSSTTGRLNARAVSTRDNSTSFRPWITWIRSPRKRISGSVAGEPTTARTI